MIADITCPYSATMHDYVDVQDDSIPVVWKHDDGLTFAARLKVGPVIAQYNMTTDRLKPPHGEREDQLALAYEYKFVAVGAFITGNLGGAEMQNTLHPLIRAVEIKASYTHSRRVEPMAIVDTPVWNCLHLTAMATTKRFELVPTVRYGSDRYLLSAGYIVVEHEPWLTGPYAHIGVNYEHLAAGLELVGHTLLGSAGIVF